MPNSDCMDMNCILVKQFVYNSSGYRSTSLAERVCLNCINGLFGSESVANGGARYNFSDFCSSWRDR